MSTAILAVEGVLRKDNKDPIPEGLMLFRTLTLNYRVVLSTESDAKEIDHWLKTNYVFDYAIVLTSENFYEGQPLRMRHLDLSKIEGKVLLYVDSDPDMCASALGQSVPALLFASPNYFQSHRHIKSWDSITDEQIRQKKVVAERYTKYINSEEGYRFE